jgi:uncharacterized RDD family membrane protein YckC
MDPTGPSLVSGEGVRLALAPAGVGSRVIAALIDIAIQWLAVVLLILLDIALAADADGAAIAALVIVELILVLAGYPIVSEWLTRGRTLGKLALGLRVVRDDGGPISFRHALVRGLAGFILEKPGLVFPLTTIAGVITMSVSSREKRMGDMMAGTVVLNERSSPQALAPLPNWVPVPLQPWVLSLDMHRLDDRLALSARQFVTRAHAMNSSAQAAIGEQLRRRVLAVTSPPPPAGTPTPVLLLSVLAERRRRAAASSLAGPATPPFTTPAPAAAPPAAPLPGPNPANPPAAPQSDGPFAPPT